jgi:hypothetical protein
VSLNRKLLFVPLNISRRCHSIRAFPLSSKRLDFTEERLREAIERIDASPPRLEKARENVSLLRRHGHPLAIDRGEAADRVTERDQPAREATELVPHLDQRRKRIPSARRSGIWIQGGVVVVCAVSKSGPPSWSSPVPNAGPWWERRFRRM